MAWEARRGSLLRGYGRAVDLSPYVLYQKAGLPRDGSALLVVSDTAWLECLHLPHVLGLVVALWHGYPVTSAGLQEWLHGGCEFGGTGQVSPKFETSCAVGAPVVLLHYAALTACTSGVWGLLVVGQHCGQGNTVLLQL